MEEYKILYAPAAKEDLLGIYAYIAHQLQAPQAAFDQTNRIRSAIRRLAVAPCRHPAVEYEPWISLGLRKLPVNHYIIFYLAEEATKEVKIIRILYGGRDLQSILSDSLSEK